MEKRAILVGVNTDNPNFNSSMLELSKLAETVDINAVGQVTQNLDNFNSTHYVGTGKLSEISQNAHDQNAGLVIFNDELSPSQIRNLNAALNLPIMDRTSLILKIFSQNAHTREARLQVEVAHLQYMLPRLIGSRQSLEQQSGGVGTRNRGAGEKLLELNRRQIQDRISRLNRELSDLAAYRKVQRKQRKKNGIPVVSLVGYTNAGKSSLMNALLEMSDQPAEKQVLEKNMLFATLETSVRSIVLPDNKSFLLTDTVGFVSKLPHHLVKAFRSTLEEVGESDLLIHVIDSSDPNCNRQIDVTNETLREIGVENIPSIYAFNKSDCMDIRPAVPRADSVFTSAKLRTGIDQLIDLIRKHIFENYVCCKFLIPYNQGDIIAYLNQNATVLSARYEQDGTLLELECKQSDFNRFQEYVQK